MLLFFAVLNVFLSPLFLLISPLVLSLRRRWTRSAGSSFAGGLGAFLGGLAMAVWGGPRRRRLRGVLLSHARPAASSACSPGCAPTCS